MKLRDLRFISYALICFGLVMSMPAIIGQWHEGYSTHLQLRYQTEAFLHGSLAVQPLPYHHEQDWAWGNGMQQVWGLGVPLIRLPFEVVAKIFGAAGFPDRLVFLFFYIAVAITVLRAFQLRRAQAERPWEAGALAFAILFCPALTALLRTRFEAYEEVISYGSLAGFLLFALLIQFVVGKKTRTLYLLSSVAGFMILIRPTLLAYGLVTFAIAGWYARDRKKELRTAALLFMASPLFYLMTNAIRFGSPFQPGHSLNLSGNERIDFSLKFGSPIRDVPFLSAAAELLSSLFFVTSLNGYDYFKEHVHPWQTGALRFREFYSTTFDRWTLAFLLMAWTAIAAMYFFRKSEKMTTLRAGPIAKLCALWSALTFGILFVFYMRLPIMASRYMVDFTPAISVGIAGLLIVAFDAISRNVKHRWSRACSLGLTALAALWIIHGNRAAQVLPTHIGSYSVGQDWLRAHPIERVTSGPALPDRYQCGDRIEQYEIHYNGEGWRIEGDCTVTPLTAIYMTNPQCVSLFVEPVATPETYQAVQVKFGSEFLERKAEAVMGDDRVLTFCSHRKSRPDSKRIEQVQIGWVDPKTLNPWDPGIKLMAVEKSRIW